MKTKILVMMVVAVFLVAATVWAEYPFLYWLVGDIGTWSPGPYPNDEYRIEHITGTLAADNGRLFGLAYRLVNDSPTGLATSGQDTARVRALIGVTELRGAGSVRGIHTHATGAPGSTGLVNAANFQVTCTQDNGWCQGVNIVATGPQVEGWSDPGRPAQGLTFQASNNGRFNYLVLGVEATVENGFALLQHGMGGRLVYQDGQTYIESPEPGVVKIQGQLQNQTIQALEARVAALEGRKTHEDPSTTSTTPTTPVDEPWYCETYRRNYPNLLPTVEGCH